MLKLRMSLNLKNNSAENAEVAKKELKTWIGKKNRKGVYWINNLEKQNNSVFLFFFFSDKEV